MTLKPNRYGQYSNIAFEKMIAVIESRRDELIGIAASYQTDLEQLQAAIQVICRASLTSYIKQLMVQDMRFSSEFCDNASFAIPITSSSITSQAVKTLNQSSTLAVAHHLRMPEFKFPLPAGLIQTATHFRTENIPDEVSVNENNPFDLSVDDVINRLSAASLSSRPGVQRIIRLVMLTPNDIYRLDSLSQPRLEALLRLRAVEMEIEMLITFMQQVGEFHKGTMLLLTTLPLSQAIFHNTNFSLCLPAEYHNQYAERIRELYQVSQKTGTLLVSYQIRPSANDLTQVIVQLLCEPTTPLAAQTIAIRDDILVHPLLSRGQRTPTLFTSLVGSNNAQTGESLNVGVFYLKTSDEHLCRRVEFPCWMYENQTHQTAAEILMAEVLQTQPNPQSLILASVATAITDDDVALAHYMLYTSTQNRNEPADYDDDELLRFLARSSGS
jgi:hypothetical protein